MKSKSSEAGSLLAILSNHRITDRQKAARRDNMAKARETLAAKRAEAKKLKVFLRDSKISIDNTRV